MAPLRLIALVLSTFAACVTAGAHDPYLDRRLRPLVEEAMRVDATPGLQVAVVMRDGRLWTAGFGVADLETGRPVTPETRFYLASTTKALTALAGARLHARGELDLDASFADVFPGVELPACADPEQITIRSLLTHSHGLRNQGVTWRVAFTGEYHNQLLLTMLRDSECIEPGVFRYSNLGYDIF
ncbi:MAG: serine hydrolase domain-containing protein, partial [Phycisphaerales bacterium]